MLLKPGGPVICRPMRSEPPPGSLCVGDVLALERRLHGLGARGGGAAPRETRPTSSKRGIALRAVPNFVEMKGRDRPPRCAEAVFRTALRTTRGFRAGDADLRRGAPDAPSKAAAPRRDRLRAAADAHVSRPGRELLRGAFQDAAYSVGPIKMLSTGTEPKPIVVARVSTPCS